MGNNICTTAAEEDERGVVKEAPTDPPTAAKPALTEYLIVGESGATVREGEDLTSELVSTLDRHTVVQVAELNGRRARLATPVSGWCSLTTANGYVILTPLERKKMRVTASGGAPLRSSPEAPDSAAVVVAPQGSVVEGWGSIEGPTGLQVRVVFDGVVSFTAARMLEEVA